MPIYTYKCPRCGNEEEEFRKVEERHEPLVCCCGTPMQLRMSPVANSYISGYPYFDKVLDQEITDPAHKKRVLKQQGLEERG